MRPMKRSVLLTGATGFIGGRLAAALAAEGAELTCVVKPGDKGAAGLPPGAKVIEADLARKGSLLGRLSSYDTVYHLASFTRPLSYLCGYRALEEAYFRNNAEAARHFGEACLGRTGRFIFFSSIAAAGVGAGIREDDTRPPITAYGRSKRRAEEFMDALCAGGLPAVTVRPGTVYGPGNTSMLVLFRFIRLGHLPSIGPGRNRVPLCYVGNLLDALELLREKGRTGEKYFIVDEPASLREFAGHIAAAFGTRLSGLYVPKGLFAFGIRTKELAEAALRARINPFRMDLNSAAVTAGSTDWTCSREKLLALGFRQRTAMPEAVASTLRWYREAGLL